MRGTASPAMVVTQHHPAVRTGLDVLRDGDRLLGGSDARKDGYVGVA